MKKTSYIVCLLLFALGCESPQKPVNQEEKIHVDPHTFAIPSEAVVKHLNWDATVDFEKGILHGVATWTIEHGEYDSIIHFDIRNIQINDVSVDGKPCSFDLGTEQPFLGQDLSIQLPENATTVTIAYETMPGSEALQFIPASQTASKRFPFLLTQSQAILARTWIPCQDSPGIRFTYSARVKVPEGMLALMSAENPTAANDSGIYTFEMPQPIPSYLMALAAGDIVFKPISERTGIYAEPTLIDKAVYEFADMEKMVQTAENLYGPYAWGRYDLIVLPASFPFGGMENPRLTFATPTIIAGDRSLTALVAHELAHSWSGNLVTNKTWNDFWLNEGFTTYFERRIMEAMYGRSYSEMLEVLGYQDLELEINEYGIDNPLTCLKLKLENADPDEAASDVAYEKGYLFLRILEEKAGRAQFDAFLKNYFTRMAFKTMDTEEFLALVKDTLFKHEAEKYASIGIEKWIYEPGLPVNFPEIHAERFNKVDSALQLFAQGTPASKLATNGWSTHEWVHFLRHLPEGVTQERMAALDATFHFTNSGNSEIAAAWFEKSLIQKYTPAYANIGAFLNKVGRRKFLIPLYKAMLETQQKQLADSIYATSKANYHPVSVVAVDRLFKELNATAE